MLLYLLMTITFSSIAARVLDIHKGVIVHLFEWKYSDIAKECEEFLAPNGFAGVQISPPNENAVVSTPSRPWWERYQPISYRLVSRSGSQKELQDMLDRCNKVGVRVFADAVLNHMTGQQQRVVVGVGGSTADPMSYSFPAIPYTVADFHRPPCDIDYLNTTRIRNCELMGLRDIDQSRQNVRRIQVKYLNKLIELGVAGFRVDAAKHMWPTDLKVIYRGLEDLDPEHGFPKDTRPLIYQQVVDLGGEAVKWDEYSPLGMVTDFRYGIRLGNAFQGKLDLATLKNFGTKHDLLPDDVGLVFVDNHDTQRDGDPNILTYKKPRPYKMAIAFMMAYPWGTPRLMSSYNFDTYDEGPPHDYKYNIKSSRPISDGRCSNGWTCEHRWSQVVNMVRFHNVVAGTEVTDWWDNGKNQIAFCRGKKGFIAFNRETTELSVKLQTCLSEGEYCDVISGNIVSNKCTGKTVKVDKDGTAKVRIIAFDDPSKEDDAVLALHIDAKLKEEKKDKRPGGSGKHGEGEKDKKPLGGEPNKPPSTGGNESMCEQLLKLLVDFGGGKIVGPSIFGSEPTTTSGDGLNSKCQNVLNILQTLSKSGTLENPVSQNLEGPSKCERILDILENLGGIKGDGIKNINVLMAAVEIQKLERLINFLSKKSPETS